MNNIFSIWQGRKDSGTGFEALIAPHIDCLYRLGYRFSGTRHDAEDLVQELLVKLYPRSKELGMIEMTRMMLQMIKKTNPLLS